jgi:hypothetical protein
MISARQGSAQGTASAWPRGPADLPGCDGPAHGSGRRLLCRAIFPRNSMVLRSPVLSGRGGPRELGMDSGPQRDGLLCIGSLDVGARHGQKWRIGRPSTAGPVYKGPHSRQSRAVPVGGHPDGAFAPGWQRTYGRCLVRAQNNGQASELTCAISYLSYGGPSYPIFLFTWIPDRGSSS